jgi:hypothetical protein
MVNPPVKMQIALLEILDAYVLLKQTLKKIFPVGADFGTGFAK